MKIYFLVFIIFMFTLIVSNITNDYTVRELSKRVACLERGQIYVGDNLCAERK